MSRTFPKPGTSGKSMTDKPKRDRSLSAESIPKKKLKATRPEEPSSQQHTKPNFEPVRAWLSSASQNELDNFSDFLVRKRSKSKTTSSRGGSHARRAASGDSRQDRKSDKLDKAKPDDGEPNVVPGVTRQISARA